MKKLSIAVATSAIAGMSLLSASPAMAVVLPFDNCTEAANARVFNIPSDSPAYQAKLDADKDGFGCDAAGNPPFDASIVAAIVAENAAQPTPQPTVVPTQPVAPTVPVTPTVPQQMGEMPTGGADTGVAQTPQGDDSGALALGGGLLLAAVGGVYMVRRRVAADN